MTAEKLVSKYALSELFQDTKLPIGLLDKDKKVLWYNNEFKNIAKATKLKGRRISSIFIEVPEKLESNKDEHRFLINRKSTSLRVKPLKSARTIDGYLVTAEKISVSSSEKATKELVVFQNEFKKLLKILVKEKSINVLTERVISSCLKITRSTFGVVIFNTDNKETDLIYVDHENIIKNPQEIKTELRMNYTFITKWLMKNKKSLVAENKSDNIGFNLTKVFNVKTLLISPCFFDNSLEASIVLGGKNTYDKIEINLVEQLSSLLSYAISSIKVRELNQTLETKLLQTQKLETIGKLSSGMAHDFNNLLSSIFGSLDLLKKRIPPSENVTKLLSNIEDCSVRARELTKGLLSYGKPTPKMKEAINPNNLLTELIKVARQTFPKKITFNTNIEDNLKDILGNSTEIYQVLLNLCVNAKEAIEGNGTITITAKNVKIDDTNTSEFPLLEKGDYVEFLVKDSGSGIDEDNLQKIFDPYFSTKQKDTGSGLGLYVTYGIVKAHNGHIEVSSKLNVGTEFDIYIPAYGENKESETGLKEKIILLVDDEEMLRDLLADLLESKGFSVVKVASSLEALRILTEEIKADLVVIDYNMPEMNGIECANKIRELKLKIPIILSTGSLSVEESFDPKKTGINRLLSKPYEFKTMLATIEELI